jgi:hypothetical protein
LTVKQAGEGLESGSTPNHRSSTPKKKKNPKQKDQKGERTLEDPDRKGTGSGGRGGRRASPPSSLGVLRKENQVFLFYFRGR